MAVFTTLMAALFLLGAMGMFFGVFFGGLGDTAIQQQIYLLGSIAAGVIGISFSVAGIGDMLNKAEEIKEILERIARNNK